MAQKGDGARAYFDTQTAERDRLLATIARFNVDVANMQAKVAVIEADLLASQSDFREIGVDLPIKPAQPVTDFPILQPSKDHPWPQNWQK